MIMRTEARTRAHKEGFALLQNGAYQDAQKILSETIELHGSHVSLHSDLTFAYYLAGDMGNFRLSVARLEQEFEHARALLSPRSRILTLVSIAKFCEELGRVSDALAHIEQAILLLSPDSSLNPRVRAQKLRLLASFGREDEVAPLYRDCLHATEANPQDLIECFHALLLAEARLLGLQAAWPRFLELSKRAELQSADLRLCLLDLLEIAIEKGDDTGRLAMLEFLSSGPGVGELDAYEGELFLMARLPRLAAKDEDFFRWTRSVSPMCHLRLLALEASRPGGSRDSARTRLVLALEGFSHQDRQMLVRKWRTVFKVEDTFTLEVDPAHHCIKFGQKLLTFNAKAQPWELLRVLSELPEGEMEAVLSALGKGDNESERESLRIAVLRLNKKLIGLVGLDWVIKFSKQSVQLNPLVRFQFAKRGS